MDNDPEETKKAVIWFDIDNTLYSAESGIGDRMTERALAYLQQRGYSKEDAVAVIQHYRETYGQLIRGLMLNHDVDPNEFDEFCDQAIPLEEMLFPDPALVKLLQDIDSTKVHVWAFTNAYVKHARRVLRILGLDSYFEGIVYGDFSNKETYYCKPQPESFVTALEKANVHDPSQCYFVDDSKANIRAALQLGWGHCVHFCEDSKPEPCPNGADKECNEVNSGTDEVMQVKTLDEIRNIWPEIFLKA